LSCCNARVLLLYRRGWDAILISFALVKLRNEVLLVLYRQYVQHLCFVS